MATKFSQYGDKKLKYNTKVGLIVRLKSAGVGISVVKGKRVGNIQYIYCKN